MRKSTLTTACFSLSLLLLWSCNKEANTASPSPVLPSTPYEYKVSKIDKISIISLVPVNVAINPIALSQVTNLGVSLGRVIFNEPTINLSGQTCNGCHATVPHKVIDGTKIANELHPPVGIATGSDLVRRMMAKPYYAQLFQKAYGSSEITPERVSDALAQYMAAMSTHTSAEALAADERFSNPFK